jgi:hypothetical protein
MSDGSFLLPIILGFILGIGLMYFILGICSARLRRIDERTLVFKLPFMGMIETEEDTDSNKGFFAKKVVDDLEKASIFRKFIDTDLILQYARDYNLNYIGLEGDVNGSWSDGRLAFTTLSQGHGGRYNIHLNPNLDRVSVCERQSQQVGVTIEPDELYTFLFLHEVGHTRAAGNECYFTALINHSLSGGRRSARRRRELKNFYLQTEKFADDFAIQQPLKLREGRTN